MKAHTLGARAIRGAKTAKISRATPATTLRLPRSAHRARGTAHSSWATAATKVTAPRAASWMWKVCSRLVPMREMPLPKLPGTRAAAVSRIRGAKPLTRRMPMRGGGLAFAGAGHDVEGGDHLGVLLLATTSCSNSSGTAKSNSTGSAMEVTHYP